MEAPRQRLRRVELEIEGMRTVHCVRAVFQALAGVPGVLGAEVGMGRSHVDVDGELDQAALAKALELIGYGVKRVTPLARTLPTL